MKVCVRCVRSLTFVRLFSLHEQLNNCAMCTWWNLFVFVGGKCEKLELILLDFMRWWCPTVLQPYIRLLDTRSITYCINSTVTAEAQLLENLLLLAHCSQHIRIQCVRTPMYDMYVWFICTTRVEKGEKKIFSESFWHGCSRARDIAEWACSIIYHFLPI